MTTATSRGGCSRRSRARGGTLSEDYNVTSRFMGLAKLVQLAAMVAVCVVISGCRHVADRATAVSDEGALWRSDFQAFTETLHAVAADGRVPSLQSLLQRYRDNRKSVTFITDGLGGIIEVPPREGTVGCLVNRHFSAERVRWVVTMSWEPGGGIDDGTVSFGVEQPAPDKLKAARPRRAEVVELEVPKRGLPADLTIRAGDELVVEGRIGDANQSTILQLSGVNTAYHYYVDGKGRTVFVVALEDAKIRRANDAKMGGH